MIQAPLREPLKLISVGDQTEDHAPEQRAGDKPDPPCQQRPPSTTDAIAVSSLPVPARG